MSITRKNHFVPIWYQERFLLPTQEKLCYLDLQPDTKRLSDGQTITMNSRRWWTPKQCFFEHDLYTTSIFGFMNDDVERYLFGTIDKNGSEAVRALISNDIVQLHKLFNKFFEYLDAQKIRTPKGLDWLKTKYSGLTQLQLMVEMQQIRQMHSTMWVEAVREIVSAEDSETKFIITDHPVTIYNPLCSPDSAYCKYPNDPDIAFIGSQTIFPLNLNHCLILTNLEYAQNPLFEDLLINRTNARHFGQTLARIDTMIRSRKLTDQEVKHINYILKTRACRHLAAAKEEWLYPEIDIKKSWPQVGKVLLPPRDEIYPFGGEIYVGHKDGSTHYQDAFGRTVGELPYLKKPKPKGKIGANNPCICGSGKKYKKCCRGKDPADMPLTTELSIRERNLLFFNAIVTILGLDKDDSTWEDVRKGLSDKQVKDIHEAFEGLWPRDTNIVDLLPRPDKNVLRALYAGLVDPRVIVENVISKLIYFDEILVVNPFMNPANVNPEFSPVKSPGKYKQETLKNVLLFLQLIPFIKMGIVNLIPDPCSLNYQLQRQIWKMAESRLDGQELDDEHTKQMEKFFKDDFERSILGMPDEILIEQRKKSSPGISDKEVEGVLRFIKQKRLKDPLALLQPTITKEGGEQMIIIHLTPNFELGFFLAQLTGSLIYTDNKHRWQETTNALSAVEKAKQSLWEPLAATISKLELVFEHNPEVNLMIRKTGKMASMRHALREVFTSIQSESDSSSIGELNNALSKQLEHAWGKSRKEWERIQKEIKGNSTYENCFSYTGKIDCAIPTNGFGINTVHRLLLSHGSNNYLKSVPVAMFLQHDE